MDEDVLIGIAARTGLGLKFLSKDVFLTHLLSALKERLDERCVLKGGTAIVRGGHLDAPRFSEDIDVDLHTSDGMRDIADEFRVVLADLEPFDVEAPRIQGKFIRFDARYRNHFGEKDRVKIEIAPKAPDHMGWSRSEVTRLASPFTEGEPTDLRTYSREALFAMKVIALSSRQNGKDPFDIRGMWRSGVAEDLVIRTIVGSVSFEGGEPNDVVNSALENLEWMSQNTSTVMNITSHYVPRRVRPDWGIMFEEARTIIARIARVIL